tara:strand:- start:1446 stop:2114 length:669 start_codon:yes stop_codon:yes gene_type:complete
MIIEVCIESIDGLKAANQFNLDRIEICSDLKNDGLTPEIIFQKNAEKYFSNDRFIMIRPHFKSFQYSNYDVKLMKESILLASKFNPKGVVFGALNEANEIDIKANEQLINCAKSLNLKCTFHRAFDICSDPIKSFNRIKSMGFDWILTSGQQNTAEKGIPILKKLVKLKGDKIKILAGGGISVKNCKKFKSIGLDGIHFSIDKNQKIEEEKIKQIKYQLSID